MRHQTNLMDCERIDFKEYELAYLEKKKKARAFYAAPPLFKAVRRIFANSGATKNLQSRTGEDFYAQDIWADIDQE